MFSSSLGCKNAMLVNKIYQETHDVWTLELIANNNYPYLPGQYALVGIKDQDSLVRAYTISSSPGLSPFISLTVRHIPGGRGSSWLTQDIKINDTLWLSDAQGDFTCVAADNDRYLMLAAGCGITPIMSMIRWLLAYKPKAKITLFYHASTAEDIIFAMEWPLLTKKYSNRFTVFLATTQQSDSRFLFGRLSQSMLKKRVTDINQCTIMACGPQDYMNNAKQICLSLDVSAAHFFTETFHVVPNDKADNRKPITIRIPRLNKEIVVAAGHSLLTAMESHHIPIIAACRSGVCGSCKTQIISGEYHTNSQLTLTTTEIERGYVLACSCQAQSDLELI